MVMVEFVQDDHQGAPVWLADWEVLQHLLQQKEARGSRRTSQAVLTVEFECLEYLRAQPCARLSSAPDALVRLLRFLSGFPLTKLERLVLCNRLPTAPVDFYAAVEECEERFSADQVDSILSFIQNDLFNGPSKETL